ncbi:MAG TPA: hypothetical protein VJN90_06635 [Candidatus Acidoferrales bacterium]|nr:hypothetical protein [Candidatus Acidoferrales bacterium]
MWEPILPTDWRKPGTATLARISDPRAVQFWDPHHLASREIQRSIAANGVAIHGHTSGGNLWDLALLYLPGPAFNGALPAPAFLDGPIVDVTTELASKMQTVAK